MDAPNPDSGEEWYHTNTQVFGTMDEHNRFAGGDNMAAPWNAPAPGAKVFVTMAFTVWPPSPSSKSIDTGTVASLPLGTVMAAVADTAWTLVEVAPRVWVSTNEHTTPSVTVLANTADCVPPAGGNVSVCTFAPQVTATSKFAFWVGVPFTNLVTCTVLFPGAEEAGGAMLKAARAHSTPSNPNTAVPCLYRRTIVSFNSVQSPSAGSARP